MDKPRYCSLHQGEPEPESPQTEEQPEDVSSSELGLKSEVLQDPEGKTSGPTFHLFSDSDLSSHTSLEKAMVSRFVGGVEGDSVQNIYLAFYHTSSTRPMALFCCLWTAQTYFVQKSSDFSGGQYPPLINSFRVPYHMKCV